MFSFYTKESRLTHGGSPNAKSDEQAVCGQEVDIFLLLYSIHFSHDFVPILFTFLSWLPRLGLLSHDCSDIHWYGPALRMSTSDF